MKRKTKFQDEDFELGEVVDASIMYGYDDKIEVSCTGKMKHRKYDSIKDFTDHWEDAPEEPKGFWMINILGIVEYTHGLPENEVEMMKAIGNYFETKEKAEKAVEKLKAWKRLKDKGFRFKGWSGASGSNNQVVYCDFGKADVSLLNLLFGGEE